MRRHRLLFLATMALVLACGNKNDEKKWKEKFRLEMEDVMQTHRAGVQAKLAALKSIGIKAEAAPRITAVQRPVQAIQFDKLTEGQYLDGDLLLINAELASRGYQEPRPTFPLSGIGELETLAKHLVKTPVVYGEGAAAAVGKRFERLTSLKYAFVIRVHEYEKPVATMVGGENRFEPGRLVGDAQLFSFDDATKIGAFAFEVVQDASAYADLSKGAEEVERGLVDSLRIDLTMALDKELHALLDGSEVGTSAGAEASFEHFRRQVFLDVSAKYLAALLSKVELESDGNVTRVKLFATSPSVLTNEGAAPDVKAIVVKALGAENIVIEVIQATDPSSPDPSSPRDAG